MADGETHAEAPPRVFISYCHLDADGNSQVPGIVELANRLRSDGIDAHIDQYESPPPPSWPEWMYTQIGAADFVLVVCDARHKDRATNPSGAGSGTGAGWEGAIITVGLYQDPALSGRRFIPVAVASGNREHVPYFLALTTVYDLSDDKDYEQLLQHLRGVPLVPKPPLGSGSIATSSLAAGRRRLSPERPEHDASLRSVDVTASRMWDGHLEVYVVDENGAIHHRWRNAYDEDWSDWHPMPGPDGQPVRAVAAASETKRQELTAISSDGAVWSRTCKEGEWSDWAILGSPVS